MMSMKNPFDFIRKKMKKSRERKLLMMYDEQSKSQLMIAEYFSKMPDEVIVDESDRW